MIGVWSKVGPVILLQHFDFQFRTAIFHIGGLDSCDHMQFPSLLKLIRLSICELPVTVLLYKLAVSNEMTDIYM